MIRWLLIAAIILGSPSLAHAVTTYYLDATGGSDTFNCTQAQTDTTAKASIEQAIKCLNDDATPNAGNTLSIKPGTYTALASLGDNSFCDFEIPSGGGSMATATILTAFDTANKPVIKVTGQIPDEEGWFVFNFFSSHCTADRWIILDNLIIDGDGAEFQGWKASGSSSNIRMINSECRNANSHCFLVEGAGGNYEITDNWIHDNVRNGLASSHGMYVDSSDTTVSGNEIHDNGNFGIQTACNTDCANNVYRNNIIYNQQNGIQCFIQRNCQIYENIIYHIGYNTDRGPTTFAIIVRGSIGGTVLVHHNTIYDLVCGDGETAGAILNDANDGTVTFRDNIVQKIPAHAAGCYGMYMLATISVNNGETLLLQNDHLFDIVSLGNRGGDFIRDDATVDPGGTKTITGILNTDPQMNDPGNQDFTIVSGGNACGAASDGSDNGACDCTTPQAICTSGMPEPRELIGWASGWMLFMFTQPIGQSVLGGIVSLMMLGIGRREKIKMEIVRFNEWYDKKRA